MSGVYDLTYYTNDYMDDSVYFNRYGRYDSVGAYQSERSPWASWYKFRSFPNDYASWWGFEGCGSFCQRPRHCVAEGKSGA